MPGVPLFPQCSDHVRKAFNSTFNSKPQKFLYDQLKCIVKKGGRHVKMQKTTHTLLCFWLLGAISNTD